jgi:hypothetical protein
VLRRGYERASQSRRLRLDRARCAWDHPVVMADAAPTGREPPAEQIGSGACSRVAVLFERGRNGASALCEASELAARSGAELTVIVLASQVTASRRCGGSPEAYNCAVLDAASSELHDAAHDPSVRDGTRFRMLIEGHDPPLKTWLAQGGFDLMLLPSRRRVLRSPGHPAARGLRQLARCDVRVVTAPTRRTELQSL